MTWIAGTVASETHRRTVFVSQPMAGLDRSEILARQTAMAFLFPEDEILNTVLEPCQYQNAIEALGLAITMMAGADMVVMMPGWHKSRGCRIEHQIARTYGLPVVYLGETLIGYRGLPLWAVGE